MTAIALTAQIRTWLGTQSPLAQHRGNEWTLTGTDDRGNALSDSLYEVSVAAVAAGVITVPAGVDVWVEYASPVSAQVYVSVGSPVPVTTVSNIRPLVEFECNARGIDAAQHALAVMCDIASGVLDDIAAMSHVVVAQTSTDATLLASLARTSNDRHVLRAIQDNPYTDDEVKVEVYLRVSAAD